MGKPSAPAPKPVCHPPASSSPRLHFIIVLADGDHRPHRLRIPNSPAALSHAPPLLGPGSTPGRVFAFIPTSARLYPTAAAATLSAQRLHAIETLFGFANSPGRINVTILITSSRDHLPARSSKHTRQPPPSTPAIAGRNKGRDIPAALNRTQQKHRNRNRNTSPSECPASPPISSQPANHQRHARLERM